jgi:hypothetical protein
MGRLCKSPPELKIKYGIENAPMNEVKHSSHQHGKPARESIRHEPDPYWRRAHHDWRVWVGLFFMMAAITIYVFSDDLSFFPRGHRHQPVTDASGK